MSAYTGRVPTQGSEKLQMGAASVGSNCNCYCLSAVSTGPPCPPLSRPGKLIVCMLMCRGRGASVGECSALEGGGSAQQFNRVVIYGSKINWPHQAGHDRPWLMVPGPACEVCMVI